MKRCLGALVLICGQFAGAVSADVAVLIGNSGYDGLPNVSDARLATSVADPLQAAGFEVISLREASPQDMAEAMVTATASLDDDDRLIVFVAGQFVAEGDKHYLLARSARGVTRFDAALRGFALDPVLDVMAERQGRAFLLIGRDSPVRALTTDKVEMPNAPNGVAVFAGPTESLARRLVRRVIEAPSTPLRTAFDGRSITATGFLPNGIAFLDDVPANEPAVTEEGMYWEAVLDLNTAEAFLAYVRRYPNGAHVAEANAALGQLRGNEENAAKQAEQALALNRDARRQVQRNLALLEFNPRGIDGIFGRGTRSAIRAWQVSRGFDESGFLSANQLSALTAQANVRAAELEAEAEARRAEELRRDRAFWVGLGTDPSPDRLRDYLRNFPDGQFSEIARAELAQIEAEARAEAQAQDRADWDAAVSANTVAAYRQYLGRHPNGVFAETARDRIRAAEQDSVSDVRIAQDRSQEAQITQLQITRVLIEQRLRQRGQNPGAVDGRFTRETRRAIRRFQRTRNLPATGYVGQDTAVALLSG